MVVAPSNGLFNFFQKTPELLVSEPLPEIIINETKQPYCVWKEGEIHLLLKKMQDDRIAEQKKTTGMHRQKNIDIHDSYISYKDMPRK